MIKRSPAIFNPSGRNARWLPNTINNSANMIMTMAGIDLSKGITPDMESYDIDLEFDLAAGQTITNSITSRAGTWILLERRASVTGYPQSTVMTPAYNDMTRVSCYIVDDNEANVILIEDQPISLVFGTGEWQASLFPETWNSVNNRVYSVKNTTGDRVVVNLGFKLIRVAPASID